MEARLHIAEIEARIELLRSMRELLRRERHRIIHMLAENAALRSMLAEDTSHGRKQEG